MYYTDYHSHSCLSPDGHVPLSEMADAAVQAGLSELCITDHYDLLQEQGGRSAPYDWTAALQQMAETAPRYQGRLTLRLGMELGSAYVDPAYTQELLALPQLDFVIGSLHNQSPEAGGIDFFLLDYSTPEHCYDTLDNYFASMAILAPQAALYDVLGHIIYPLRYMPNPVSLNRYMDRIQAILKATVYAGRGIEVNTYRGKTLEEWRPILALYKDCGGELITVGADAHYPETVARGVPEAYALLQDMGFHYVTTYNKRKPNFIKL